MSWKNNETRADYLARTLYNRHHRAQVARGARIGAVAVVVLVTFLHYIQ